MLSKEDYLRYTEQMNRLEVNVRDLYQESIKETEDEEAKSVFSQILVDENRHIKLTLELMKIFERLI
jgi:rubrerythrin